MTRITIVSYRTGYRYSERWVAKIKDEWFSSETFGWTRKQAETRLINERTKKENIQTLLTTTIETRDVEI